MQLTDCHVHVSLYPGPDEICEAAYAHGISLIGVSCSLDDSVRNLEFAKAQGYKAMIGIHPWMAENREFPEDKFERLLSIYQVSGFGECGLDTESPSLNIGDQVHLLSGEIEFACRHALPLNLHVYKAHDEMIRLLRRYRSQGISGAVHNFTFSKELARDYLDCGMYLSVGRYLLKKSSRLVSSLQFAGPDRIILESDYDHVHSGPYDPELIIKLAEVYAEIFDLSFEAACIKLQANVNHFLKGVNS